MYPEYPANFLKICLSKKKLMHRKGSFQITMSCASCFTSHTPVQPLDIRPVCVHRLMIRHTFCHCASGRNEQLPNCGKVLPPGLFPWMQPLTLLPVQLFNPPTFKVGQWHAQLTIDSSDSKGTGEWLSCHLRNQPDFYCKAHDTLTWRRDSVQGKEHR